MRGESTGNPIERNPTGYKLLPVELAHIQPLAARDGHGVKEMGGPIDACVARTVASAVDGDQAQGGRQDRPSTTVSDGQFPYLPHVGYTLVVNGC